ncbi:MAG: hypothetical protein LBE01_03400, partial [Deltaproteobacteria bacterium]|nr:hypothetical protein [Deltaproteobacteria bacterium]
MNSSPPNAPTRHHWRLMARLPLERLQELLARLLVERPLWDPEIVPPADPVAEPAAEPALSADESGSLLTGDGPRPGPTNFGSLEMTVSVAPGSTGRDSFSAADLDYFRETLKKVASNRSLTPKTELVWLPIPPLESTRAVRQLGPWLIETEEESQMAQERLTAAAEEAAAVGAAATANQAAATETAAPGEVIASPSPLAPVGPYVA